MNQQDIPCTPAPPPPPTIEGEFIFSHRSLMSPKFFPQINSGFCMRYSHWNAQKRGFTSQPLKPNFNKVGII